MKLCLIPPGCLVLTAQRQKYQMLIPEGLANPDYAKAYQKFCSSDRYYTIMDNGAWESKSMSPPNLIYTATEVYTVQELIVPDVVNDNPEDTLIAMKEFFEAWRGINWNGKTRKLKLAAVVHGSSLLQAFDFVETVASKYPEVKVIMPAKHLAETIGDPEARVKLAQAIEIFFPRRFEIHFLGYSPDRHFEVFTQNVRSIDTAAPYISAWRGFELSKGKKPPRPEGYFGLPAKEFDGRLGLVQENVNFLNQEVRNDDSRSW